MTPADPPGPGERPIAANDNGDAGAPAPEALHKVNEAVFQIARLIGCRMAQKDFAAANDNDKGAEGG